MADPIPEFMLAGRLNVRTRNFAVTEVPVPSPGAGEVLIRVRAAGICLSDVHLIQGELSPLFLPGDTVTLGHEAAGTVAALGPGVRGWTVDQHPGRRSAPLTEAAAGVERLERKEGNPIRLVLQP